MKDFVVLDFVKEKTAGVAPSRWLERECEVEEKVVVNWEDYDRETAEEMMDHYIETGRVTEKRKTPATSDHLDSSDDECLKEKQKKIRKSYSRCQEDLKTKFLKLQEKDKKCEDGETVNDEGQDQVIGKEVSPQQGDEQKKSVDEQKKDEHDKVKEVDSADIDTAIEETSSSENKENEQMSFSSKKATQRETPFRPKRIMEFEESETSRSSHTLKKSRIDRRSRWLRNIEEVVTSDDEEDLRLTKDQLFTKCQLQAMELQKKSREIMKLEQENQNLRAAIALATELPELLQKIRKVKSSASPPSSTSVVPRPTATTSSVLPKTPILPQRSPLTPVTPVSPEDNNAEEVLNFGTVQLVKKDVFRHVGSKSSHLVNYLMEEVFTDEELGTCSLTGAKGRCKDSTDIKPALDGDKLADIIAFTKSQWSVTEDKIKKIIRNKLNNCHKKARVSERPPSTT